MEARFSAFSDNCTAAGTRDREPMRSPHGEGRQSPCLCLLHTATEEKSRFKDSGVNKPATCSKLLDRQSDSQWRHLEESCRRLDEMQLTITEVDLSQVEDDTIEYELHVEYLPLNVNCKPNRLLRDLQDEPTNDKKRPYGSTLENLFLQSSSLFRTRGSSFSGLPPCSPATSSGSEAGSPGGILTKSGFGGSSGSPLSSSGSSNAISRDSSLSSRNSSMSQTSVGQIADKSDVNIFSKERTGRATVSKTEITYRERNRNQEEELGTSAGTGLPSSFATNKVERVVSRNLFDEEELAEESNFKPPAMYMREGGPPLPSSYSKGHGDGRKARHDSSRKAAESGRFTRILATLKGALSRKSSAKPAIAQTARF